MKPKNRLSKEHMSSLPIINFQGEVIIVKEPEEALKAVEYLSEFKYLGFDTESKPAFQKGESFPVSILQLACEKRSYIFKINEMGLTYSIANLLETNLIKKIGVGIDDDISKLQEMKDFTPGGFIDLSQLAAEKGMIQTGVRALTARYLKKRVTKSAQRTNWSVVNLSEKQILYAATDAWICLKIYPKLIADKKTYPPEETDENRKSS